MIWLAVIITAGVAVAALLLAVAAYRGAAEAHRRIDDAVSDYR